MCRYTANAKQYFEDYLPGPKRTVFHTKKGLSWRNAWGVLRYSANNAFVAFVLADQMQKQASCSFPTCHEDAHHLMAVLFSSCSKRFQRHLEESNGESTSLETALSLYDTLQSQSACAGKFFGYTPMTELSIHVEGFGLNKRMSSLHGAG